MTTDETPVTHGIIREPCSPLNSMDDDDACFGGVFDQCVRVPLRNLHRRQALVVSPTKSELGQTDRELIETPSVVDGVHSSWESTIADKSAGPAAMQLTKWSAPDLPLRVFPLNKEQAWQELEDDLFLILSGRSDHLSYFRRLHGNGLVASNLLRSLAYLSSRPKKKGSNDDSSSHSMYYEHVSTVAGFLAHSGSKRQLKLAALRTLMECLSPIEAAWQMQEAVLDGTLDFLTHRGLSEWEFMEHSEMVLIWELRAMCLRQLEREKERIERVAAAGDQAAIYISGGAKLLEAGMTESLPILSSRIDSAGEQLKEWVKPDEMPLIVSRDAVVALAYSDALKRASKGAMNSTRMAVSGICDISSMGIDIVSRNLEGGSIGEKLLPHHPESREIMKAAGKVGIATIGAAALLGEVVVDTSRALAAKTASVTADVVQHKYGTSAGQVLRDAGDTTGNVIRTVGNVAKLEGKAIAKSVAKSSGKRQVENDISKAADSMRLLEEQAVQLIKQTITGPTSPSLHQVANALASIPITLDGPPSDKRSCSTVPRNSEVGKEVTYSGDPLSIRTGKRPPLEKARSTPTIHGSDLLMTPSSSFETDETGSRLRMETAKRIPMSSDCSTSATSSMKSCSSNSKTSSQQGFATRRRNSRRQSGKRRTPLTPDTALSPKSTAKKNENHRCSSRLTTSRRPIHARSRTLESPIS